jgi:hypothetical protein
MNDQQALSIFAADPEAGLVDGGKYQNSCGFLAKLSSAGNLAFKTMKCVVNPDIGPEVASPVEGISPRTRIAMQSNAVLPRRNISPLACIADKRKGIRKGPPVTTELRVPCSGPDTAVNGCSQQRGDRRLAQTSASPQATEQFANLARTWIRLADLRQVRK